MRILSLFCLWSLVAISAHAGDLKVGDPAPDFKLHASDGRTYTLVEVPTS